MLGKLLASRYGPCFLKGNGYDDQVAEIKKSTCFIAENFAEVFDREQREEVVEEFQMMDGRKISVRPFFFNLCHQVKQESFLAPEIFFQPALYAPLDKIPSLPDIIIQAITSCPFDTWYVIPSSFL